MKELKEILLEKLNSHIDAPELRANDGKVKDRIAYDHNGDGWIVECYCYADGGAPEGCDSLKSLLKKYDISGAMADCINDYPEDLPYGDDTFIVGAVMEKDEDEKAAWIWDYDGICYENK